jgi:hypothetical protein
VCPAEKVDNAFALWLVQPHQPSSAAKFQVVGKKDTSDVELNIGISNTPKRACINKSGALRYCGIS